MGRLGWSPAEALAADVNLAEMALRERYDQEDDLYRVILGAMGAKLPPKEGVAKRRPSVAELRAWAREHNQAYHARTAPRPPKGRLKPKRKR